MTTTFDVEAATNAIAALERTITTPSPGIISSYDYGTEPIEFDNDEVPAVVHIERGPSNVDRLGAAIYMATFEIESRVLLIQDVAQQVPLEPKTLQADLWLPLFNLFETDTAKATLTAASGAFDYFCQWDNPSFTRGDWPIFSNNFKVYWLIRYLHIFTFQNTTC